MISNLNNLDEQQRLLYEAAVIRCSELVNSKKIPIKEAVQQIIDAFKALITDTKKLEDVLVEEVTQEHSPCIVIKNSEGNPRHWWTEYKNTSKNLSYWERYKTYLGKNKHWSRVAIEDLDDSTDQVMDLLANPQGGIEEERRGLVYGEVQSGKTAHYIGLINKAFSAGYRIFIVLTGMQNSLRSQTQSRIDEEVLGFETSHKIPGFKEIQENIIGVGKLGLGYNVKEKLQSLTNRDENGDINSKNSLGIYLPPFIIVTKKNATPLNSIIRLLTKSQIAVSKSKNGKHCIPAEYPALIIDDEADQASINTKKDEDDATKINGLIRKMLNLFQCKSYVGYTATPFANIFIPHRVDNDEYGKDLFPKDFIAKTPCPQQYIGARAFFGLGDDDTAEPMPLIRPIKEGTDFLSQGTKKNDPVGKLPKDLETAVKYFMISTAVRNLRGQINKPNTMLVHIVRFVEQQDKIKKKLSKILEGIENFIRYGDTEIKKEFQKIYEEDYLQTSNQMKLKFSRYMDGCSLFPFESVWNKIVRISSKNSNEKIKILAVNGKSDDSLIYQNHKGEPFNVIVIGGDKLSRGLTLEGLTISYFTRNAGAMDTLLQMGRWFGYRPGYIDVCRLFSTSDLVNKFEIISYSAEDLSAQFDDMNTVGSNPEHFGLKVATNPNILISSKTKIRTGADYKADFSASLTQTRLIDADSETLEMNYEAVDNLLSNLDSYRLDMPGCIRTYKKLLGRVKPEGKTFWTNVPSSFVIEFFKHYKTPRTALKASSKHIAEYIDAMNRCGGVMDWTICLADIKGERQSWIATNSAKPIEVHGIQRNNKQGARVNQITRDLHVLISAGDEELDLSESDKRKADEIRKIAAVEVKKKAVLAKKVRANVRNFNHGFLLLYPILKAADDIVTKDDKAPYAFAVVFPDRKDKGELKCYRLNEVAVEMEDE